MGHLLDVVEERLGGFEEGLEVGALPEALQVPFDLVSLDADDLLLGLVDAAGDSQRWQCGEASSSAPARR
jgi:hypothetical protein